MGKDVAVVETGHGKLGNNHLEESRESREHAKFFCVETETGSGGEVATFHDTRWDEDLWMLSMDNLETG